jgi:hypothetical protein
LAAIGKSTIEHRPRISNQQSTISNQQFCAFTASVLHRFRTTLGRQNAARLWMSRLMAGLLKPLAGLWKPLAG